MLKQLRRILPFLLIITSLCAALHYFIYSVAVRDLSADAANIVFVIFAFGLFLMPASMIINHSPARKTLKPLTVAGFIWMGWFMIALFLAVVESLASLFSLPGGSWWILPASVLIALWSLWNGLSAPRVVTHTLKGPAFLKNFSLAQVSDLHIGIPFLNEKWLASVVAQIEGIKPDAVAITGDLTDGEYTEVARELSPLAKLQPRLGKFYITGNHEYIRPGDWENRLKELGFTVLHNDNKVLNLNGGNLLMAGVPDRMVHRFHPTLSSLPDKALNTRESVGYRILLAHEPSSVFDIKTEKCDLVLSGHTHGGQIFPFGIFVRMVQPLVRGFKKFGEVLVFAHQGTGFWGPPMRWFTRAEIVVFKWTE